MGGDRDGNPNVRAETTRDVVVLARLEAINAYFQQVGLVCTPLMHARPKSSSRAQIHCIGLAYLCRFSFDLHLHFSCFRRRGSFGLSVSFYSSLPPR